MYNNYEMAKNDIERLKQQMEVAEITSKKLDEIDPDKSVFYGYGHFCLRRLFVGSMYMLQSHENTAAALQERKERLQAKIESLTVSIR